MAFRIANGHFREPATILHGLRTGVALHNAGRVSLSGLVTHPFKLEEIDMAFQIAIDKPEGFVKATVDPVTGRRPLSADGGSPSRSARLRDPAVLVPERRARPRRDALPAARSSRDKEMQGVVFHGRYGLEIDVPRRHATSSASSSAVEEAERLGLVAWIYDEMNWPSGTADKRVLKARPELAQRYLECVTLHGPRPMVHVSDRRGQPLPRLRALDAGGGVRDRRGRPRSST